MKILITCFLPFNKSPNNYSIEVAKLLNSYDLNSKVIKREKNYTPYVE